MTHDDSGMRSDYEPTKTEYDVQIQQIAVDDAQIVLAE